ncbi:MAG: TonB-dependent siderophore receptor [Chloroflexi bacterium]|nr:TonB-dependent siderophore receptor [Chloroflexota bacterium]|tara:strand:- start:197 stop:2275 length:2079 start_codon:yes stop_codon:yes gene_type:complete
MSHSKTNLRTIIVFFSIAISSFALAEESNEVEEIVVKGNVLYSDQVQALKTPVPILDVPQTLSIVTDEDIRKQGIREIGDIVRYTPGVNTSQGEGHRDAVVFRGVRSTADFYQDGVRDDVQYYRSLYNVEQVEILRGPNALLFGRGGTGGIINRVTKKAVLGEQFGSFDFGVDDFGSTDLALDYNVQSAENSALRINLHVDALENHRDFYDGDRVGLNPTLRVALSDNTTLDLSYEYADHERMIDRGIPTANGVPVEALDNIVFGTSDINLTTLEADIFRGSLTHNFSETSKGIFSVTSSEFEKLYQNLYASGYNLATNVVTLDGYRDPTERENLIISGNLINEFQTGSATHTLLIGAELIDTDNKNHRYDSYWSTTMKDKESFNTTRPLNIAVNSAGVSTNVNFNTKLKSKTTSDIEVTSIYIQDQIDVNDNLKLMLGGRLDQFDITVDDIKAGTSQSRDDDEFSPRAGVIFKPQDNVSLYLSYSESFLPRSGEQFKKLSASSAALDPDVYENSEIGVNWDITNDLSLRASYFDSEQTVATRDESGEAAEIVGLQVDGIELEIKGQVNDQLYVQFGYSDMDGKTSSGGEPREIPDHTISLWTTYQVNDKFGYGLGVTRQGESNISNNKPGLVLPDYTRVDFAAFYEISEDLSIQLNIENLTDELYFPHSHSTHQASVGEPVNARVSIRRSF